MSLVVKKEVKALLHLLTAEENRANIEQVRRRLLELGTACVPLLEQALQQADGTDLARIESVLMDIHWGGLETRFRAWADQQGDLEEGAFLLAQFCYPKLDVGRYRRILDEMAAEAHHRIKNPGESADAVKGLTHYLFHDKDFHGNAARYYDPDNSYINRVIDQRTGIPITLSLVVLLLARRLELPIVGVGLPGHFMVRFEGGRRELYIDAFRRGRILSRQACIRFIKAYGYSHREEYFLAATPPEILVRMMRNLIFIYGQLSEGEKVTWLSRYVEAVS